MTVELRDLRCTGCGRLLARLNIERGTVEIVCKGCKTKTVAQR